jgi:uncharacterized protein YdaL
LLGHFQTTVTIGGLNKYKTHEIDKYDYIFYVGYSPTYQIPANFAKDILGTLKPVIWINNGFIDFCKQQDVEKRFGFSVTQFDQNSPFTIVKAGTDQFTKGTSDINIIKINNKNAVEVWATAVSTKPKKEVPYMVKSGNLIYVADMPFTYATETDRYLYFSDKLHDILNEKHAEQHQAIIRIEDVTPLNDPNKLREVADILAERGIPFLVGVVPIYVNPSEDRRVTLTERPEVVDALKYMVRNGGSIVMHGVTHQYKGVSTDDCEFWDAAIERPIADDNTDDIAKKIETGIDEFFKNGLYPIAWETPHYQASIASYQTFAKFFSTAVEQRMVINNYDYGQYFPYIIEKDLYGQKIYPENLGYIPLNPNMDTSRKFVNNIIKNTAMVHEVRDGIISCFFHPFLNLSLLEELVDGIKNKGFSFIDVGNQTNWVKAHDKVILTGSQTYNLTIDNSFLYEAYFDTEGNIIKKSFSKDRLNGPVTKKITLNPGEVYVAEGLDYYLKEPTFKDVVVQKVRGTYRDLFADKNWHEAKVSVCWNQSAKGAAYYDQSSLISIFKSINVNVDTVFLGQDLNLEGCNLLVVPYSFVDSLNYFEYPKILRFVKNGGSLITDRKNKLIEKLGVKFFSNSEMKLHQIRDKYFPQELITWKYIQLANKFEYDENDEILCEDASTALPVAIGRPYGKGKFIYFNTAFDPFTPLGYSNYPFALDYIKRYFQLNPVVKRENLEFYFEPSLRKNISVETLVKLWVKQGIRIIHIDGWLIYKKYTYDYKRLIKLAHANGILVYAWIEPPYISEKFWQDHPEWREKNYKNEDINSDPDPSKNASWRYPVALTDPNCMKTVLAFYDKFLKDYDWDGVNIAELSFESGAEGFKQPKFFAPMHPTARAEFKKEYGYDMKQVFDSTSVYYWKTNADAKEDVVDYRIDKITEFHDKFLKQITDFAKTKSGFGVIVTFYDTYFSPELKEHTGVSSDKIIELQKKYGCMLQPEDPQNKWSTDPTRYEELGKYYAKKMSNPSKLLLDLNILAFRKRDEVTPFPTLLQTGIESYHLINSASKGAPRFTIYSEGSCNAQDLSLFSYSSSGQVKYQYTENGYKVSSPYSFTMQLPADISIIRIDDQSVVGYRDNSFIIPAGEHTISIHTSDIPGFSSVEIQPQLLSFTGNLLEIKYGMRQVNFVYDCSERALVSLNRKPTDIKVDGKDFPFEALRGNDCFCVFLPVGKHLVAIVTGDKFTYGMNITSLWSISAIAIYGTIAVILLIIMYFALKIFRKRLEN